MILSSQFLGATESEEVVTDRPTSVSVLGPVEITGPDGPKHLGAVRQRRILSVLAVAAMESQPISANELIEAVYGDDAPQRAHRSLSTELWRCRRLLGADAIIGGSEGYSFDPHVVEVDLVRFMQLLATGRAALDNGDSAAAERQLSEALSLWHGTPLVDWSDHPHGQATLARLEELRLGATEDLADALSRERRHREAAAALQPIIEANPAREHAWALLIECHLALGDRRRARTALDAARRTLSEHGVDLGSELRMVRDRLRATVPATPPLPRAAGPIEPTPGLIGRRPQLTAVMTTLRTAIRTARPTAVVVVGEAGIGKSALLSHVASAIGSEGVATGPGALPAVGWVFCDRRLSLPYAALIPLLKRLNLDTSELVDLLTNVRGDSGSWIDAQGLSRHVVGLVESAAESLNGLVLVVEDAQWATPELIEVLLALLARHSPISLAMAVSIREPGKADPALRQLLAELRHRAAQVVHLAGLNKAQTLQLLGRDLDTAAVESAHRLTGGNPLYLRQLTVRPDGGFLASPSLADALDEHIDSLPVGILAIIEVAAAIGTHFDARALTSAVAHPPLSVDPSVVAEALRVAASAGMISSIDVEGHDFEFVHALIRDRLYDRTPVRDRMRAHALIGIALSRLTTDTTSADLLAFHSQRGWPICPTLDVVERLSAAGEFATQQLGFAEATRYFRKALDFIAMDPDFHDDAWLVRLLAASGQAAAAAEDLATSRASYLTLFTHGERTVRPAIALRGALGIARTYATERMDDNVIDRLSTALDNLLTAEPSATTQERGYISESIAALQIYRPTVAREMRERATTRDPASRSALISSLWEQETVESSLAIARELVEAPDSDPLGSALRLWTSEVAAGQRALTDEPAGIWSLKGGVPARWEARLWRITTAMTTGQFTRALRLLDAAEKNVGRASTITETAGRIAQLLGQRMWIALQRGDWTELRRLAIANRPLFTARRPLMRTVGAQMQIALGDYEHAMRYCDDLVDEFLAGTIPARDLHASVVGLGNACLWLHHDRGIRLCRERLRPWEGQHVLFYFVQHWGSVRYQLGKFAAYAGDLDEAVGLLRIATAEHHDVGALALAAQSQWLLASSLWHRDRGSDRSESERYHAAAIAQAQSFGMNGLANRSWPPTRAFQLS